VLSISNYLSIYSLGSPNGIYGYTFIFLLKEDIVLAFDNTPKEINFPTYIK